VELRATLEKGDLNSFGEILHRGWQLKRGVASRVTNDVVEANYQLAREAGAEGGKLLGAGAGGFLLLSCREERQQRVREALSGLREMSIALIAEGSQVLHNDGRNDPILAVGKTA
jgi:D-glycero-alpha-D-manno-heptose-7-phosphate kinase